MKKIITAFTFILLCAGCKDSTPDDMDKYTMDYSISSNQFGVVVVVDGGMTRSVAQKQAFQRAAEITHSHGYRYFTIEKEAEVAVLKTTQGSPDMPTNEYYRMIQSRDLGRDHSTSGIESSTEVPGLQIEFSCQEDKPSGRHYDACNFGLCN